MYPDFCKKYFKKKWCLEAGIAFSRNLGSLTLIEKKLQNEKSRFFFCSSENLFPVVCSDFKLLVFVE